PSVNGFGGDVNSLLMVKFGATVMPFCHWTVDSGCSGAISEADGTKNRARFDGTFKKYAAANARSYAVHACTDVTGFGLLIHAKEMANGRAVRERV
ncbi:AIR synthase-related protein, partial [Enterococcus faecalis]|uniref:AIR synthase-related protein n=1 Tax=Enterococcus faecalis TaxID=1351 RepID=UPI0024080E5C